MITIKKNGIIIASLGLLLVAAGFLNYYLTRSDDQQTTTSSGGLLAASRTAAPAATAQKDSQETIADTSSLDSITVFAQQREQIRDDEVTYLDSIINNEKTDEDTLRMAQEEKLKLVERMELEMVIEGLLAAKGFEKNIVTCGETSINVVVDADTLSEIQVAQILEIVRRESGESAENIKIIPVVS